MCGIIPNSGNVHEYKTYVAVAVILMEVFFWGKIIIARGEVNCILHICDTLCLFMCSYEFFHTYLKIL